MTVTIPEEAVEAAAKALCVSDYETHFKRAVEYPDSLWGEYLPEDQADTLRSVRAALEAAAPFIAAKALEAAADEVSLRIDQIEAHQVPEEHYASLLGQREEAVGIYQDLRARAAAVRGEG